ncbi:carboxymuconolactone decarboxylase family protein [Oxyplasma meridianum]|uniref:carboxymuconolactone decarboxylase family protein n=1 Tax=Oxyplasma meridianum TaxID=3073602 RepID=UPI00372D7037
MHLIIMEASQINKCMWCLDMHAKDALTERETLQRLILLFTWRDASNFQKEKSRSCMDRWNN